MEGRGALNRPSHYMEDLLVEKFFHRNEFSVKFCSPGSHYVLKHFRVAKTTARGLVASKSNHARLVWSRARKHVADV